jgi:ABC-type phosphate transport system permease subunit
MPGAFGTKQRRVLLTALFFVVACGILAAFSYDSYFCSSARAGRSHALTTARLALGCTAWNLLASVCGGMISAAISDRAAIRLTLSTLIAGIGYASVPFWIYQGYGKFLLENTWADVSCFFTEGYGMAFPFVAAPALALTTMICEWLLVKKQST